MAKGRNLAFNFQSHAPGGAHDHASGVFHVASVQVSHFLFANLFDLLHGDFADFVQVRNARNLWQCQRLA